MLPCELCLLVRFPRAQCWCPTTHAHAHTHTSLLRSLSLDLEQDVGVPDFSDGPKVRRIHEVNVLFRVHKVSNLLTELVRAQLLGAPEQVVPNAVVRRETPREVGVSKLVQGAHHDQRRPRPAQQIPSQSHARVGGGLGEVRVSFGELGAYFFSRAYGKSFSAHFNSLSAPAGLSQVDLMVPPSSVVDRRLHPNTL